MCQKNIMIKDEKRTTRVWHRHSDYHRLTSYDKYKIKHKEDQESMVEEKRNIRSNKKTKSTAREKIASKIIMSFGSFSSSFEQQMVLSFGSISSSND